MLYSEKFTNWCCQLAHSALSSSHRYLYPIKFSEPFCCGTKIINYSKLAHFSDTINGYYPEGLERNRTNKICTWKMLKTKPYITSRLFCYLDANSIFDFYLHVSFSVYCGCWFLTMCIVNIFYPIFCVKFAFSILNLMLLQWKIHDSC